MKMNLDTKAVAEALAAPIREKIDPMAKDIRQLKDAVRLLTKVLEAKQ